MSTSLKDAIGDLVARHSGRPLPSSREALIAAKASELPDWSGDEPSLKDYDAISEKLAGTLLGRGKLTRRQARDGAWCLWGTRVAIASDPKTLEPFLGQLREMKNKGVSRSLALSFLINFREDRPGLSAIAAALRELAVVAGHPFDTLEKRFRIFDLSEGPMKISEAVQDERKPPRKIFEECGLQIEIALVGGFAELCECEALERVAADRRLSSIERIELVELLAVEPDNSGLNFPAHKVLVANALLLPHLDQQPEKIVCDRTLNFLTALEGVGDPRTKRGNWGAMPEARDIAIGWLTEQALRQFLDVVEEVNPNENWHYRRRFWEAVHDERAISKAWVVMDRVGAREARRRFGKNTGFGQFTAGSVQAGHAVLLLQIGSGVCVEWSFSGKCRFWEDAERQGAPRLFGGGYDADFLRTGRRYTPALEITHYPHEGGNAWQHKAARQIERMSGLRLSPREYMP